MKIDAKKNDLTEDEILDILEKRKVSIEVFNKLDITTKKDSYGYERLDESRSEKKKFCFCKKSKGGEIKTNMCPFCGAGVFSYSKTFESKEYAKQIEADRKTKSSKWSKYDPEGTGAVQKRTETGFYIMQHPDYPFGILIERFKISLSYAKDELNISSSIEYKIEIIPGERCTSKKKTKSGYVDCDMFEALNISSHTFKYDVPLLFKNAGNLLSFIDVNKDFAKRTAFKEVYYNFNEKVTVNSFFMMYMYLYAQYPVVELLAKMNYTNLITSALMRIGNGWNRDNIKNTAENLSKVFNPYGTTGHLSLCIPKYIGDFLNGVNAELSDYEFWCDIYSYDPISKENFEKIIRNEHFEWFYRIDRIVNLLKYGYKINKLLDFLIKKSKNDYYFRENTALLDDYHKMIELMGVEKPEMYPSDIKDIHDKTVKAFKLVKDKIMNDKIAEIAAEMEKHIPESDDFTIICPKNTNDFVEEGNRQHNCVASYARSVANKNCAIFFVRKKDNINENYITAEYRKKSLYQIKYKNNQDVTSEEAIKFAQSFCDNLSKTSTFRSI